ncbi:MAG: hypothetical protein OEO77_14495, partial [Acidimicrobiia bacterium]|nr:hypothetical protein [Acidimicrobiia bacterium]
MRDTRRPLPPTTDAPTDGDESGHHRTGDGHEVPSQADIPLDEPAEQPANAVAAIGSGGEQDR